MKSLDKIALIPALVKAIGEIDEFKGRWEAIGNLTPERLHYAALRSAQSTIDTDESQLINWFDFFVRCLARQKDVLGAKIERERLMAPLARLSEELLAIVREHGRLTVREAVALTGANRNTVKDHLRRLVNSRRLARRGRGRGTWYERT